MKKVFVLSVLIHMFLQSLKSQTPAIEAESWKVKPSIHEIDVKYINEPAIIIFDKKTVEYIDDSKNNVVEYYSQHRIIHVNDDHGIEYFNKVYLPVVESSDLVDVKARTILPGGKIVELNKDNIKDLKEEDGNLYKIFALEGLEKGAEIEYFYTVKKNTSYFGREIFQERFPVLQSEFKLFGPSRLVFELKPYNCTPDIKKDTLKNDKAVISCKVMDLSGADEEKYSSYQFNLGRIEFKLSYNNATHPGERMFTWNELSKRMYSSYGNCSAKELKIIAKIVNGNDWEKLPDEQTKIITVENYIKKNFVFREDNRSDDANNFEKIEKTKIANLQGLVRLYSAIFNELGVNHQFVFTADRNQVMIDKNFENWNNCDYILIYFPAENKFIAPTRPDFRYPWIFPSWGASNGLYCKNISIGNITSAIAEIKTVPLEDFKNSYDNIESELKFNTNLDTLMIDLKMIFGGYAATYYRADFNYSNGQEKQQLIKEMIKNTTGSEHILSSEILNPEFEDANTSKPFIVHAKAKSNELLEKAGNKILVKIGLIIGQQVEMYQEKQRRTPIAIQYPHFEERKIEFTIPDGYILKNPDDLKIAQRFSENGEQTMGFVSGYELKNNMLSIRIMEDYRRTVYPLAQYDEFKKIINASSDFNKVVLVLEKK